MNQMAAAGTALQLKSMPVLLVDSARQWDPIG